MSNVPSEYGNITTIPRSEMNIPVPTREPNNDLDRNAFLNLLITQLRHQDPLNPMDDRDFIAQMAQFSALEQMMNLNATFERTQAFGMIGKVICADFTCPTTGDRIELEGALVTSVIRNGDSVMLTVTVADEYGRSRQIDVPFDAVREVSEDFHLSIQLNNIHNQIQGQRAAEMVGMYVQGFALIGDGVEFVEGRVDAVNMQGSLVFLVVGNREIAFPQDVFSVTNPRTDDGSGMGKRLIGNSNFVQTTTGGERNNVTVTNVVIRGTGRDQRAYLQFDNNTEAHVRLINHVTDALAYIGRPISFTGITGTAESITMVGGIPFINVREAGSDGALRQIDFLAYLTERTPNNAPPVNNSNSTGNGDSGTDGDDA
ncbi:MAG: hypothetical protein FWF79_08960 [Defluviitaleaceae bacterium]|nr:hypothetical protein [Defluviitaleaceae bacterium]